jgi:hypothetical protein
MRYDDPTQSLTRSDVEFLQNCPEPVSVPGDFPSKDLKVFMNLWGQN